MHEACGIRDQLYSTGHLYSTCPERGFLVVPWNPSGLLLQVGLGAEGRTSWDELDQKSHFVSWSIFPECCFDLALFFFPVIQERPSQTRKIFGREGLGATPMMLWPYSWISAIGSLLVEVVGGEMRWWHDLYDTKNQSWVCWLHDKCLNSCVIFQPWKRFYDVFLYSKLSKGWCVLYKL